jgi:Protein of unknown function (DUF1501)
MSPFFTRRQFLRVGAFGTSFTFADLLRAADSPSAERPAHAKAAVLIFLPGGPSHLDTFDPKPDAPTEVRGEFGTIPTAISGVRFVEHLPLLAGMADKLAILRAVTGMGLDHVDVEVMTGHSAVAAKAVGHPSLGSVVAKVRGLSGGVPPFVSLRGLSVGCEPGFLGISYRPYVPGGQESANLKMPANVTSERFADRRELLATFDNVRRDVDASGAMAGMDSFQQQAFELVISGKVRNALDISREPQEGQERYNGVEQFLKARRLIEAGVGCVTLSVGEWDTHQNNFRRLKENLPNLDRGVSALVGDLHERGMGGDVIVMVCGEFGRTPVINREAGRDHWNPAMSVLLAGGGLKMGQVIGETTSRGDQPKSNPCTVQQLLATVYRAVGIDPNSTFPDRTGRPVHLLEDRAPISGLA